MDWQLFQQEDYFAVTLLDDECEDTGKVQFYRGPLTRISVDLATIGFVIECLLAPQPTEEFQQIQPDWYEHLSKNPWFLVVRAWKGPETYS
ncbi:MAG: class I SAM-dependent methyltransferase [Chloroflexi bacterium AL-W]|nr:class I SAM-dependent methyltransferase [Chloroflexi bacterium AL-N1]NOK71372.1 class I SAM-dependent methyltransferase [Chloroflexi bacterium AL-N10]NOK78775.1 class I SAM-dependent methyltransferase [Chloroflexi bacterium AL-N5]NOK86145.1 class I SAM-dependent methyltransferase [Chloroflexi bacterium AL-W]NOK93098.1 class I SAM-dependent methyltransferase [Chloroflexi bacterium AL-N15]